MAMILHYSEKTMPKFKVILYTKLQEYIGEGNGKPLQYSCPENPMEGGAWWAIVSVQFSSVAQSCLTLCDPMNHSTPGLPVHHYLLEFTQTHDHRVGDAIQPFHPLLSPSPPAPNPSQHQDLFQ